MIKRCNVITFCETALIGVPSSPEQYNQSSKFALPVLDAMGTDVNQSSECNAIGLTTVFSNDDEMAQVLWGYLVNCKTHSKVHG